VRDRLSASCCATLGSTLHFDITSPAHAETWESHGQQTASAIDVRRSATRARQSAISQRSTAHRYQPSIIIALSSYSDPRKQSANQPTRRCVAIATAVAAVADGGGGGARRQASTSATSSISCSACARPRANTASGRTESDHSIRDRDLSTHHARRVSRQILSNVTDDGLRLLDVSRPADVDLAIRSVVYILRAES
jgi:hypothetical protein